MGEDTAEFEDVYRALLDVDSITPDNFYERLGWFSVVTNETALINDIRPLPELVGTLLCSTGTHALGAKFTDEAQYNVLFSLLKSFSENVSLTWDEDYFPVGGSISEKAYADSYIKKYHRVMRDQTESGQ